MGAKLDISGMRFGRLIAIESVGPVRSKLGVVKTYWRFKCDCGNIVERKLEYARRGDTKSCGCLSFGIYKKLHESNTLPSGVSSFNGLFSSRKRGAKVRGYSWGLSKEEFRTLVSNDCHYCGEEPHQTYKSNTRSNGSYIYNGIDRIDNTLGYVLENCVSCCKNCNMAKRAMSRREFLSWIEKVYLFSVT